MIVITINNSIRVNARLLAELHWFMAVSSGLQAQAFVFLTMEKGDHGKESIGFMEVCSTLNSLRGKRHDC